MYLDVPTKYHHAILLDIVVTHYKGMHNGQCNELYLFINNSNRDYNFSEDHAMHYKVQYNA